MPVVDDLLADVDGRAVLFEGLLDGFDGAIHAGAVTARGGEQDALASRVAGAGRGLRSGHASSVRAPARAPGRGEHGPGLPHGRGEGMIRDMTPPLPLPVRIAAGLVATAVEQARDLPRLALELPVTAVSQALQASMRLQQKVTELAIKGDQVLGVGPPIEDEPAWATFDEDLPPRRNGRSTGPAARGRDRRLPCAPHPTRSSSRAPSTRRITWPTPEPVADGAERGAVRHRGRARRPRPARLRPLTIPQLRGKLRHLGVDELRSSWPGSRPTATGRRT